MYTQKTYRCGKVVYIEKTQTRRYLKGEKRKERVKPTPEQKEEENRRAAERKLKRKIAANFGEDDYWITLTYKRENRADLEQSEKNLKSFMRKLRAAYQKEGAELKYILVTEWKGKAIHHHMLLNGIDKTTKLVKQLWPYGRPDYKMLEDTGDWSELAAYMVKETSQTFRSQESAKKQRYTCSRNLTDPKPEVKEIWSASFRREPKPWKGYEIVKGSLVQGISEVTGYMYQYYSMREINDEQNVQRTRHRLS